VKNDFFYLSGKITGYHNKMVFDVLYIFRKDGLFETLIVINNLSNMQ
jgi:hypothetical protein